MTAASLPKPREESAAGGSVCRWDQLVLPLEALKGPVELPGLFLRFIGLAEVTGAIGLILPGIFRIRRGLARPAGAAAASAPRSLTAVEPAEA